MRRVLLIGVAVTWLGPAAWAWTPRTQGTPEAGGQPPPVVCAELASVPSLVQTSDGTGGDYVEPSAMGSPVPADTATATALDLLVRTLAACLSDGESEIVATLATERYLGALAGGGPPLAPSDYVALAAELPVVPVAVRSVGDVTLEAPGQATADVVYVLSHQLVHARWRFIREDAEPAVGTPAPGTAVSRWLVDAEMLLPVEPPPDASIVPVELDEYSYAIAPEVQGPTVVLAGTNVGDEDHELLVLRLRGVVSPEDLLRQPGPQLPDDAIFIGQVTVPAGGEASLTLVDLSPGRYAIVCLLPDADGMPHLALGMGVEVTVL